MAAALLLVAASANAQVQHDIEVVHHGSDNAGEQFVYLVRDHFRQSGLFRVQPVSPLFKVTITTLDISQVTRVPSIAYAVVLTYQQESDVPLHYEGAFITSMVATCPVTQIAECARDAYVATGTEAELTLSDRNEAMNDEMRRRYEAATDD